MELTVRDMISNLEFRKIKPAYDERNVSRHLLGADVFGRVAGGVRGSRGRPLSASAHESRAAVSVFAWMAGKCVS
jgi:hypothetical protein